MRKEFRKKNYLPTPSKMRENSIKEITHLRPSKMRENSIKELTDTEGNSVKKILTYALKNEKGIPKKYFN
jgi:hypothetical protein